MRPRSPSPILHVADTPAFLITDFTNIRYLTGLQLSSGVLLALPRRFLLFVDSRYRDMAERAKNVSVRDIAELPDVMREIRRCGFEADDVSVQRHLGWKKKLARTTFVPTVGVLQVFRRQKEREELRALKKAHRMTRELLRRVPSMLRRSISEEKLARQLLSWTLELGGDGMSFDPIVAFGTHTSCPHHKPTNRVLQKGHIVQIDVGVKYKGYCADMSEVYFTVKPTKTEEQIYRALTIAKNRGMRMAAKAGVTNHELDKTVRGLLTKAGIEQYFTHSLGHGVGLDVHEGVSISSKAPEEKLLKNEVVTIEPGVYFPGKFGMRVEDMVYVE